METRCFISKKGGLKVSMKALSVIWKIPDDRLVGFSSDKNGLIVVRDLCEYLGRKIDSYLILGKDTLPAMKLGHIHIVDTEKVAVANSGKSHIEIMVQAFELALDEIQPDIVHIHDCGDFCRACIKVCVQKKIPYVFTAHAFIGKDQKISNLNERDIAWQKEVMMTNGINVVAVGKGLAEKIAMEYPNLKKDQIRIIQNGTDFRAKKITTKLKTNLGFHDKKILICPGKITKRKNQIQIIKAFQLLSQNMQNDIGIIFCGNDRLNGELQHAIETANLDSSIKYVGVLDSEQMPEYYSISDGLIMSSVTEGLSIAALEAIAYGIPAIMFADVECAKDLDDERVTSLAKERTDKSLANAIEKWLNTDWDANYIMKYASQFSMDRVADEYISCYKDVINTKGSIGNV